MKFELLQEGCLSIGCNVKNLTLDGKTLMFSGLDMSLNVGELAELTFRGGKLNQVPSMDNVKKIHIEIEWEDSQYDDNGNIINTKEIE